MPRKNTKTTDTTVNTTETEVIKQKLDTVVARANGQFANPTTHDTNESTEAAPLRFTGDYVERFDQLFAALDECSTASSDVRAAIASSLSWSLASSVARFTFALETVQHSANPRRIRNPDMAAEEIERLEKLREQREFILSITSRMTPERLLPEPSVFTDENLTVPEAKATAEELAKLNNMPVSEVNARLRAGHAAQRQLQMTNNRIIASDPGIKKAMEQAVRNAYGSFKFYDHPIDPTIMSALFNKVAEKLDSRISRNTLQQESTSRIRKQAELAGQNRMLQRVLAAVEDSIDEFEEQREIWNFEIVNNLHRQDDRQQVEAHADE
jgi:anion-transporting  ArsA/GET3 family ATPase